MPNPVAPLKPSETAWFVAGTKVMTLRGEVAIEQVHTGDRVLTLSGNGSTLKPVAAVRSLVVDLDKHPHPEQASPIRIAESAVEPGMPIRALRVSPGLALSLDDGAARVLVPAFHLLNGATITREPGAGRIEYWQVVLAEHDILMADGMAAEAGIETAAAPTGRGVPLARPDPSPNLLPGARDDTNCAPVALGAASAPLHARLLEAAEALGYRQDTDPGLTLTMDGAALPLLILGPGRYQATLPPGAAALELHSRSTTPADINPIDGDTRRFGVPVARLLHDGEALPLDGPACAAGFLAPEREGDAAWRWTTGDARITLTPQPVETTLELHIHADWARYWIAPEPPSETAAAP